MSTQSSLSTAGSLIQSILKEGDATKGDASKFNEDEQRLICVMLCTAEYCMETSQQLEEKLIEKTDPKVSTQISLSAQQDIFHGYVNVIQPGCDLDCLRVYHNYQLYHLYFYHIRRKYIFGKCTDDQ